jgi:hypothetical protein
MGAYGSHQFKPAFLAEKGTFSRIGSDGHGNPVEKSGGAFENVEMSVGDGVESAGIDAMAHGGSKGTRSGGEGERKGKRGSKPGRQKRFPRITASRARYAVSERASQGRKQNRKAGVPPK